MSARRFQLHLSSIVVLTLATGAMLGLNLRGTPIELGEKDVRAFLVGHGWPLDVKIDDEWQLREPKLETSNMEKREEMMARAEIMRATFRVEENVHAMGDLIKTYRASRIAVDLACALLIVGSVTLIAEWFAHRRRNAGF